MNILEIFMKDMVELISCRWVPSPQSKRTMSGPDRKAVALVFRYLVGTLPPVPRKTISTSPHRLTMH
jgi:hypothetical protein